MNRLMGEWGMTMSSFQIEAKDEILLIKCPSLIDRKVTQEFEEILRGWLLRAETVYVLDLTFTHKIEREFYRSIIQVKSALKKGGKSLRSLVSSNDLVQQIRADGMDSTFSPIRSLDELTQAKPSQKVSGTDRLILDFIQPFLQATKKTFEVQCKTKIEPERPFLKSKPAQGVAIAGLLSLASNGQAGSFALCMSEGVFLSVYENMFGEKLASITPEIEDAAGEIVNIIYGQAKIELNTKGYTFDRALPTVMRGEGITVRQSGPSPAVVIPFKTPAGSFHIEIEFDRSQAQAA